jgi:membrane-bound inhibitor of C-type lysozyme
MLTKTRFCIALSTVCIALLISSCVNKPSISTEAKANIVKYVCDRGTQLKASFSTDGENVKISTQSVENLVIPSQAIGSGFLYSNGRYELRGKDNEAMWSVGRMAAERCVADD